MSQSRPTFFYSAKAVDVQVEPGAWDSLPENIKEAIIQRSKQEKKEDPTITMLREQLKDERLPQDCKIQIAEMLNKLQQNNTGTVSPSNQRKC